MNILSVLNVSKRFGKYQVLQDISFDIEEGTIFGFLGKNGAGKTTTMKIILGLLKADRGTVQVCGEAVRYGDNSTNRFIGFLPDVPEYYGYMTAEKYMEFCGRITGLDTREAKNRTKELLKLVGLEDHSKKIRDYSRGMKQRLGIAQALINRPKLLICDEPTSALDPIGRKEVLSILQQIKKETTILFSTHILYDVERICDNVAIIDKGSIVLNGKIDEIKRRYKSKSILILFQSEQQKCCFMKILSNREIQANAQGLLVTVKTENVGQTYDFILKKLLEESIIPAKIEIEEPSLEDLFIEVVK